MRHTRHFAGVIGAAGLVVSPFMMASVAQADDTLPPDTMDGVVGDANLGDDVPNLPVTRVVGKAASLDLMMVDGNPVALDIPDEVKENLPSDSGMLTSEEAKELQDTLGDYVVEGDLNLAAGSDLTLYDSDSLEGVDLTVEAAEDEAVEPTVEPSDGVDVSAPEDSVEGGDVQGESVAVVDTAADPLPVAGNTGNASAAGANGVAGVRNVTAASDTVGVAAPVADDAAEVTDTTPEDVDPAPREAPQLPVTGEDDAASVAPAAEDAGLPLAPLLGITGLVLGGGIGVVTLRKKLELADSK